MLVRLRILDAHDRLLLVQRGRDGYGSPRVVWHSVGEQRQQLHLVVREYLKGIFQDWHSHVVNFDEITAEHVVWHGGIAEVTLIGTALELLPDMVNCCGAMVLAWPEEVKTGVVFAGHKPQDILDLPIFSPKAPPAAA